MGKWKNFSGIKIDKLDRAIEEIMDDYKDVIFKATDAGIAQAATELKNAEKAATPVGETGEFAKGWNVQSSRYKLVRFVGNSKTVRGSGGEIALANIFEYSTTRGKPFIKNTFDANVDRMAQIIYNAVKKEA